MLSGLFYHRHLFWSRLVITSLLGPRGGISPVAISPPSPPISRQGDVEHGPPPNRGAPVPPTPPRTAARGSPCPPPSAPALCPSRPGYLGSRGAGTGSATARVPGEPGRRHRAAPVRAHASKVNTEGQGRASGRGEERPLTGDCQGGARAISSPGITTLGLRWLRPACPGKTGSGCLFGF